MRELEFERGKKYKMITLATKPPLFGKFTFDNDDSTIPYLSDFRELKREFMYNIVGKASFLGVRETVCVPPICLWLDWDLLVHPSMMIMSQFAKSYCSQFLRPVRHYTYLRCNRF